MSARRQSNHTRRRVAARPVAPVDPWHPGVPLAPFEPIAVAEDPAALVRSLGDPPLANATAVAGYFAAVTERAAAVAIALGLSADLLAPADDDR